MAHWLEPKEFEIAEDILSLVNGNKLVASVMLHRGITTAEEARGFLDPNHYRPAPPSEMPDIKQAADRLDEAINRDELIGIWGDFDADGVTSTSLLLGSLRNLGGRVEFYIPDRAAESHGVNVSSLQALIAKGIRVLLTCDTGSTDYQAIAYARGQGVDVIITDHHDPGADMPKANAFVNPKRLPLEHPLRELTGVGTAYKLIEELYARRGRQVEVERELDLVALGQVADVAVLQKDVRYLVQRGIEVIQNTERVGLKALMEIAGIEATGVTEQQIGYALAPRLNALGRLTEATAAVELFTTQNIIRARTIAMEMEALNSERQLLCNQVMEGAVSIIERDREMLRQPVLVIDYPNWPGGVIGIVAGRLAQRYNRPTILISTSTDGMGRGSARSVSGVDIREAIAAQEQWLQRFGGHPMAAGLSLATRDIPVFRQALAQTISEMAGKKLPEPELQISAYFPFSDLTLDLAASIERLAPFGAGNPPVYLATKGVRIINRTVIGQSEKHIRLAVEDSEGHTATVLWWHGADNELPEGPFDLAYTLHTRDFLGRSEVQLHWEDMRLIEGESIVFAPTALPEIQVTDHRSANRPYDRLHDLLASFAGQTIEVWGEGIDDPFHPHPGPLPVREREIDGPHAIHRRDRLGPAEVLIVWTVPPGPQTLAQVMKTVSPDHLVLFDQSADLDEPRAFLSKLTGLLKYDLAARGGRCEVAGLAAALGHREKTVRKGIDWLAARGQITIIDEENGVLLLDRASKPPSDYQNTVYQELQTLLEETAAYRAFFRRAEIRSLLPREEAG